jgi:hypothetical protein
VRTNASSITNQAKKLSDFSRCTSPAYRYDCCMGATGVGDTTTHRAASDTRSPRAERNHESRVTQPLGCKHRRMATASTDRERLPPAGIEKKKTRPLFLQTGREHTLCFEPDRARDAQSREVSHCMHTRMRDYRITRCNAVLRPVHYQSADVLVHHVLVHQERKFSPRR